MSERLNRTNYQLKDALAEIAFAEALLDGMGAERGLTLWGRIKSLKDKEVKTKKEIIAEFINEVINV